MSELTAVEQAFVDAVNTGRPFVVSEATTSDSERTLRGEVVEDVARQAARGDTSVRVIELRGALVDGTIDLQFLTRLPALRFIGCRCARIGLRYASLPLLYLSDGSVEVLDAEQLVVHGDIVLANVSITSVDLDHARVGGSLNCSGSRFGRADVAFGAQGAVIRSDANFEGARVCGSVYLDGADIGGQLSFKSAEIEHEAGRTLNAPQARVASDMLLNDGFRSIGEASVAGAKLGGQLSCGGGSFRNPGGDALTADQLEASGGVFLNRGFRSEGEIRFLGATIGGQLDLSSAVLENKDGFALEADESQISGGVFGEDGFRSSGKVSFLAARIGGQFSFVEAQMQNLGNVALYADGVSVRGDVLLTGLRADGELHFINAALDGAFVCQRARVVAAPDKLALTLEGASIAQRFSVGESEFVGSLSVRRTRMSGVCDVTAVTVQDDAAAGAPDRGLSLEGAIFDGNTRIMASGPLRLEGVVVRRPTFLVPSLRPRTIELRSIAGATIEAPLVIPEGVILERCELAGAIGLGSLLILAADPRWPTYRRRRSVADERSVHEADGQERRVRARAVEGLYRELRAALESSKAAPSAADFYYGEMEMRRLAARCSSFDRFLLELYKLVSGYGLRAWRALATYVAILVAVSAALRWETSTFVNDRLAAAGIAHGSHGLSFNHFGDVLALVARYSVTFLSPPTGGFTAWGTALLLLVRFAAPIFLALMLLALRSRVQR